MPLWETVRSVTEQRWNAFSKPEETLHELVRECVFVFGNLMFIVNVSVPVAQIHGFGFCLM